ncbi:lipocalin-like domain-containing protein [Chitinimonas sp.]|uniref:lipocalin-like domain-containing protein n=1 Tax=Chitinimonas sp. TaxID=1934313 RepID=UPI002F92D4DA
MLQRYLRLFLATLLAATCLADFAPVKPGVPLVFPRDYGAHPAFRTEWWYVTGWLQLPDGKEQGFQLTFFRSGTGLAADNPSRFAPRQLIFAHAALSDPAQGRLLHDQRSARAGLGLAEASEQDTALVLDDWSFRRLPDGRYEADIPTQDFHYRLTLTPSQPMLLQGEAGYSRKGAAAGLASYYYSQPQLKVGGSLVRTGKTVPVGGVAWLDHEWSSEIFDQDTVGWDWVGLNLDDGGALTAFRLRDAAGNTRWAGGSRRDAQGKQIPLGPNDIHFIPSSHWTSPRTGVRYPVGMSLQLSGPLQESWQLQALIPDQELDSRQSTGTLYWEGAVHASRAGKPAGRGYLELTGYGGRLRL